MSDLPPLTEFRSQGQREQFTAREGDYKLFVDANLLNSQIETMKSDIGDHGGQLKSFAAVVSAVQSSLESWKTTVVALNAAFFAAIAILATVVIFSAERINDRADDTEAAVTVLGDKIDRLVDVVMLREQTKFATETSPPATASEEKSDTQQR